MTHMENSDKTMCCNRQCVDARALLHPAARQRDPAARVYWPHSYRRTSILVATLLATFAGAAFAGPPPLQLPPPVLPPPVSSQGLTSYGTYSRTTGGEHTSLVDVMDGGVRVDPRDLNIQGKGVSLVLERFYNSGDTESGFFGRGWTSFLDARLDFCDFKYRNPSGAFYHIPTNGQQKDSRIQGIHASYDSDKGRIIYDNGMILSFSPPSGALVSCWYFLTEIADRNANRITIIRNASGVPTQIVDSMKRTIGITTNWNVLQISPPGGLASIVYTYNAFGQLSTVTRAHRTTTYSYDSTTRLLTSIQDPRGFLTKFTYEAAAACKNRIAKIEYAREPGPAPTTFDKYTYATCDNGVPNYGHSSVTDPNLHTTSYSWSPNDDPGPTTITDHLGRQTTLTYDNFYWDVTSVTNPLQTMSRNNDGDFWGRVQQLDHHFDGQDLVTTYQYDVPPPDCKNPVLSWASCALNSFLPTYVVNPEGEGTSFGYDERGNLIGAQRDAGHWVETPRNADGTVSAIKRPRGVTTFGYEYDPSGHLLKKITVTDPLGRVSETTYDSVGRPLETTSASGNQTTYEFSSLGLLRRVYYQDGATVQFQYDANGNLSMMTERNGTTTFAYNHRNQVTQKSSPTGTVSYDYDGVGNLIRKTDAGGTVTYTYDAVNQLMTLNDHGSLVTYSTDTEPRDDNNKSHKVTYGTSPYWMTINRDWDGAGRVKRILAQAPTSGTLVDLRYEYEPGSNLLQRFTDTDGTIAEYSYDALNQLTGETKRTADGRNAGQRTWTYDDNNNRASQTLGVLHGTTTYYDYDDADQLLGNTYDRDGNLTNRSDGLVLGYDAADRTVVMTPPPSAGGRAAKQTMTYTGLDQTQRTSLKIGAAPATTFTYDATGIGPSSAQPSAAGATPDYFTRTPGGRLVSLHRGGYTYFYVTDRLGSVVAVTSVVGGRFGGHTSVVNRYPYSPWGEILAQDPKKNFETVPQPFKFAGAEYDASTGLYKMGARYYEPTTGRFTQLDALGGGYRYAFNNPVNFTDPTGYKGCTPEDGPYCSVVRAPAPSWDDELEGAPDIDFAELGRGVGDFLTGPLVDLGKAGAASGALVAGLQAAKWGGDAVIVATFASRGAALGAVYGGIAAVGVATFELTQWSGADEYVGNAIGDFLGSVVPWPGL
jgi:RHS repeat-associated protein